MNRAKSKASQNEVKAELERLKRLTGLGLGLEVVWAPGADKALLGEVKGKVIYIYEECRKRALETLRHEFLDYIISREIIAPLVKQINMQKRLIEYLVYERKERLIDRFTGLLNESRVSDPPRAG